MKTSLWKQALISAYLLPWYIALAHGTLAAESYNVGTIRAVVNNSIITNEDIQRRGQVALLEAYQKYKGSELAEKVNEIIRAVLSELIDRQLMVQEAHKIIDKNPDLKGEIEKELDSFVKEAVDQVGSLTKFYEIATKEGINPVEKKRELRDDLMVEKLLKELVHKKIAISPKDIREYYQSHLEEFTQEKQVKVRHILIPRSQNEEEARKKAEDIRARAKNGEDFATLAKTFSQGPRASTGSLWEFKEVKQMRSELKEAALALEQGQISDVIETPLGLHILKAEEVQPGKNPNFEALQEEIYNKLYNLEAAKKKKEYIENLKKNAVIKVIR